MKRFAPLLLLVSCAPAAATKPVARSKTVPAVETAAEAHAAKGDDAAKKDEVPPGAPLPHVTIAHRLVANAWHACAVRVNGTVTCWGVGAVHELPPYGTTPSTAPRPVTIANLADASEVALSVPRGCALRRGGTVACWGVGKLSNGVALERTKAAVVPDLAGVSRVFARDVETCAVVGAELACSNFDGAPFRRKKLGFDVVDAAGARDHACVVSAKGTVHCWGSNALGAVGGVPKADGELVRVSGIDDAVAVSTADNFTCVVHATGYRSCWGNGQPLGGWDASYPVVTSKKRSDVVRAAVGRTTCWLLRDASVECEGKAEYGQLGTGTTSGWARAPVKGLTDALEIAVGDEHACALRKSDDVVCWGANDRGQLGDGTLVDRTVPTAVIGLGGSEPRPPPKPGSGPPIAPPVAAGPKAPWREADGWAERRIDFLFSRRDHTPSALGARAALFEHEKLAVHLDHGVVGPLQPPQGATFLALDGDDAVFAGTKDALWRAPDVLAAKKGQFQKVLAIPFAAGFSTAKGLVVAADAKNLHVSRDSGNTFSKVVPKVDVSIEHVFARSDGLIAISGTDASGDEALWIAKDGVTFVRSAFQPDRVAHEGTHLFAYGCPGGILSSDGLTWVSWKGEYGTPFSTSRWGDPLTTSSTPRAFFTGELPTLSHPPAPAPDPNDTVTGKPGKCTHGGGLAAIGGLGRGRRRGGACVGVACVRAMLGELPRETPTQLAFYADGDCERDAKHQCKPGPWKRAPHVWKKGGGAPLGLPAGCDPLRLLTAGGIGVLFCEKDAATTAIHTIGKDGVFHAEGTVPAFAIDDLTIADDGTLVVHPACGAKAQGESGVCPEALVRSPAALGTATAWRTTRLPGYAYRVLGAGSALVVAAHADDPQKLSLLVDRPGQPLVRLGNAVTVVGDLVDIEVEKDRIVLHEQITTRKETKSYVAADGLVRIVATDAPPKKKKD